mmetsp:Transcript_14692/g.36608  ORF Transcript_14692/g.36608 Transcript_14692/m.36608 type:complete len:264 (+) Transcript_14692:482-1273(+)
MLEGMPCIPAGQTHSLKRTTIQLMLSLEPRAYASSVSFLAARSGSGMSRIRPVASWFDRTSHSPSLARMMNSSSGVSCSSHSSGVEMTKRLSGLSPKALDTASTPPTRHVPAQTTTPPAFSMRVRSSLLFGLWSTERATAFPALQSTARESPTFAMNSRVPNNTAVTAVHPSSLLDAASCFRYCASVLSYASTMALAGSLRKLTLDRRLVNRFVRTKSAAFGPPCPSKMPKRPMTSDILGSFLNMAEWKSSILGRLPRNKLNP